MASHKVLCPSLPDLLRKTILTFCEGSVMFRSSLEVIGSLHIRSDNEKVTTFILDEKVVRPYCLEAGNEMTNGLDTKRTGSDSGGVSPIRKGRKISKPIKKIKYPEIYISSEVESEGESVADHPPINQVSPGHFSSPPPMQQGEQKDGNHGNTASLHVDTMDSGGSLSSDEAYAARGMEQRRLSGTSVEEVTSTAGPQGPEQATIEQQQEYWVGYEPGQIPSNPIIVSAPAFTEEPNRYTPCSQDSGSSTVQQSLPTTQVKHELVSPPYLQQTQPAMTDNSCTVNAGDVRGDMIAVPQYQSVGPDVQIQLAELPHQLPAASISMTQAVSQAGAAVSKQFLLSPTMAAGISWPQISPLLNVTPQTLSPNIMLPFSSPPLPQLPQMSQMNHVNGGTAVVESQTEPTGMVQTSQAQEAPLGVDKATVGGRVCPECGKTLKSDRMLALHMNAAHTHKETFPCPICGRVFYAASSLHSHKKRLHSTNAEKHPCPKCNKLFAFNSELSRHMQLMHGQSSVSQVTRNIEPISTSSGMTHKCMECGKQLRSKECLILHINAKHTQKLRYPCKVCGKVFYAPSSRFCHMKRSHTSLEQKFRCHHCGKLFVFHYLLRNHLQIAHNDYSVLSFGGSGGPGSETMEASEEYAMKEDIQTEEDSPQNPEQSGQ